MAESEPKRLPFEPKKRKKKQPVSNQGSAEPRVPQSAPPTKTPPVVQKVVQTTKRPSAASGKAPATLEQTRIPDRVSRRMVSRIIIFSGLPTLLGISIFFMSYIVVTANSLKSLMLRCF